MTKSISLHIGLDAVDPVQYEGWDGALQACEADAKDMLCIAKQKSFSDSRMLLTEEATTAWVKQALIDAATSLKSGDLFVLTYSGHGAQVPDRNSDEPDRRDETWVLYDRMLVDDELYSLFAKFAAGVKIFVLSDSCHSGTVTRAPIRIPSAIKPTRYRLMPPEVNARVYKAHAGLYDELQRDTRAMTAVKASVILISGCQDNQLAEDGARNGLFTEHVRRVWNNGKFRGTTRQFRNEIAAKMPAWQSPNYYTVGKPMLSFERQRPFS